jgi:hypothetical protein
LAVQGQTEKIENLQPPNPIKSMNARNGKIARLPREIRHQLNERLERAEESPKILPWLNALPKVIEVIKEDFDGAPISKQNLSEWRQGGFQEWLARRELREDARDLAECAEDMGEQVEGVLADAAATVLAVRLGRLMANWDGEVDEKFEAKSRVLNRLCRSVVQLQRGMHQANRQSLEVDRMMAEKENREKEELKERLLRPFWIGLGIPNAIKLFGDGPAGEKLAKYFMSVQFGDLDADLDILPTDTFGEAEAKPVKPARKERTAKRARKTSTKNADKPLDDNEMNTEEEAESSPAESGSVKVGQTSLEQASEDRLGLGLGLRLGKEAANCPDAGNPAGSQE